CFDDVYDGALFFDPRHHVEQIRKAVQVLENDRVNFFGALEGDQAALRPAENGARAIERGGCGGAAGAHKLPGLDPLAVIAVDDRLHLLDEGRPGCGEAPAFDGGRTRSYF